MILIPVIVAVLIVAMVVVTVIQTYNDLVKMRLRTDSAWADIDVQLKCRYDLIPNLMETVKTYAGHERSAFENIAQMRSAAMSASAPDARAAAESQLTSALRSLMAVAENYPQLQASQQFSVLQKELQGLEEDIQNARRYYNAVVSNLNTKLKTFPGNIFAGMWKFEPRKFFEINDATERENVAVRF